jgi:hypothetical protein
MRPTRVSPESRPLTRQLWLTLAAPRVGALPAEERARVLGLLARLLLEAARPAPAPEGADEAP